MTARSGAPTPSNSSAQRAVWEPSRPGVSADAAHPIRIQAAAGNVVLRPWARDDVDDVLAIYQDPDVVRWDPLLPMRDGHQASHWIAARIAGWSDGSLASWAVTHNQRVVGSVSLRHLDLAAMPFPPLHATISYHLLPAARGSGIATRAAVAAARWAYEQRGLHRVELRHDVENSASCAVAHRAGYLFEGTLRLSQRVEGGWTDEHMHARVYQGAQPTAPNRDRRETTSTAVKEIR